MAPGIPQARRAPSRRVVLAGVGAAAVGVVGLAALAEARRGRHAPGSQLWSAPAERGALALAVDGNLWVGGGQYVERWDPNIGEGIWQVASIADPVYALASDSGTLAVGMGYAGPGLDAGSVFGIDPLRGTQLWRFATDRPAFALAVGGGGTSVFVGTNGDTPEGSGGGDVVVLSAADGQ